MKKKAVAIISVIIAILLIAIIALVGVYLINGTSGGNDYREHVEDGNKYLSSLDYDNAIASFKLAIELDETKEEAYIGLAEAYEARGDYLLAQNAYNDALRFIDSSRLRLLLEQLIERYSLDVDTSEEDDKVVTAVSDALADSDEVHLDVSMLQKLSSYTNEDYKREFGAISVGQKKTGYLVAGYSRISADFIYEDLEGESPSINVDNQRPFDEAKPSTIKLADISILFRNYEGAVTNERLSMLIGAALKCKQDSEGRYTIQFTYRNCKFNIETDANGNIVANNAWNEIIPPRPIAGEIATQEVVYQGVVIDAVTGEGLEAAEVTFTPENDDLEKVRTTTADDGAYEVALIVDEVYEVEIVKEGYISERFEVETEGEPGDVIVGESVSVSPELAQGEIRIVLTWGASPRDLDSHLEGTTEGGDSVSVNFTRERATVDGELAAELDVDDTSSYGPETTTVYAQGTYRFSVHDFTDSGSEAMTNSEAQVKVYLPNSSRPKVFNIPAGEGSWWHVFEIRNGDIIEINERSDEAI